MEFKTMWFIGLISMITVTLVFMGFFGWILIKTLMYLGVV